MNQDVINRSEQIEKLADETLDMTIGVNSLLRIMDDELMFFSFNIDKFDACEAGAKGHLREIRTLLSVVTYLMNDIENNQWKSIRTTKEDVRRCG